MATSKEDILKAIEEMSVMDLVDLISDIEEKFGVTAAAAVAAAPAAAGGGDAPAAEEKDSFDVVLSAAGDHSKIKMKFDKEFFMDIDPTNEQNTQLKFIKLIFEQKKKFSQDHILDHNVV